MDRIQQLAELRREVYPYKNSAACQVLDKLLTMMIEVLLEEQLTTVEPTQTAPTMEEPLGVEEVSIRLDHPSLNPIPHTIRPSSQSDQVDTQSGPVAHDSECVHSWTWVAEGLNKWVVLWCQRCGALKDNDRIRVPAAVQVLSTSVKQPSKESVENSVEESVKSPSNGLIEGTNICKVCYQRKAMFQDESICFECSSRSK